MHFPTMRRSHPISRVARDVRRQWEHPDAYAALRAGRRSLPFVSGVALGVALGFTLHLLMRANQH